MSNYNTYIGSKKALQFPVMCEGYIKLKYSDNIATTPYGIWEHEGSFTIETLITPYDVNGFGDRRNNTLGSTYPNGVLTSQKTMPASDYITLYDGLVRQDENYLPLKFRTGLDNNYVNDPASPGSAHKMLLFKSTNTELYLENTTTHNYNQPAEYKIVFKVTLANTHTLESPNAIRARDSYRDLNDTNIQYMDSVQNLKPITTPSGSSYNAISKLLTFSGVLRNDYHKGMKLYDSDGYYIGIITNVITTSIVVDTTDTDTEVGYYASHTQLPDGKLYSLPDKEMIYTEGIYHIAAAYDEATGKMVISLNGAEIAESSHIDRKNNLENRFTFGNGDMYLAQDGSLSDGFVNEVRRKTQFMGELHEFAITKEFNTSYSSLYTLLPQYRNLLFYLNFEEAA